MVLTIFLKKVYYGFTNKKRIKVRPRGRIFYISELKLNSKNKILK